ncbi:MAG: transporter substrate-binding domain-containing protein [Proteobacteria bacterium]|nr:transporter substrate-binding domain-containing protein [Desulfobulbaceae bacterium]MBU4151434.1 transporter substrate-binding domain-containing protein [Pseudomonadota bacterium]
MKTIWHSIAILATSVISLTVVSPSWSEDKTYTLSYSSGTLFHELVRDRIKVVYERAGLKANFVALPHNRALMSANDGTIDGDVGRIASTVEKYSNLVRLNVKVMDLNGAVYTTRDDIAAYDDSILTKSRVGYILGVRWTEDKMKGLEATVVQTYPALFDLLLDNRVDVILTTEESAEPIIKSLGDRAAPIRKLQPFAYTAPIYHLLNKKNADIIPRLENALTALQKEGYWKD